MAFPGVCVSLGVGFEVSVSDLCVCVSLSLLLSLSVCGYTDMSAMPKEASRGHGILWD